MSSTSAPSMKPILICVVLIAVGFGFLLFSELKKSNERIDIQFQVYQFVTDLQFYLMDDESCTSMLQGQNVNTDGPIRLKYVDGPVLKTGNSYKNIFFNKLEMIDLEPITGSFYSAKLKLSFSGRGQANRPISFPEKKLGFYLQAKDGKIKSCGVRSMILSGHSKKSN